AVEMGQALLRTARFDEALARVELPAGEPWPAGVRGAAVVVAGHEESPLRGELVALEAGARGGPGLLLRVASARFPLRPGALVVATGARLLLSEERKSQIEVGEEAEKR